MSSIEEQLLEGLRSSAEYREGFIEESIRARLTAQIHTLREDRGWDLKTFAEKLGKKLSWTYRLEDPNSANPTIPTLMEIAAAFGVGLDVRFRRFSELLDEAAHLTPASFSVPSFDTELRNGTFLRLAPKRSKRRESRRGIHVAHSRRRLGMNQSNLEGAQYANPSAS